LLSFADHIPNAAAAADFPDAVPGLITAVARASGACERRVAASLVVLGYSARLLGPSLAVLLRDGILLDVTPTNVRFAYGAGFQLAMADPAGWSASPGNAAEIWRSVVVDDHLAMVVAAVRAEVPVAAGLLWGNIASGLVGALAGAVRAGLVTVDAATAFAGPPLVGGHLAGSGTLGPGLRFRRLSCCLYYRLPGGGYCGDCCFT
jgi:ferric iron reductase protein FhuF